MTQVDLSYLRSITEVASGEASSPVVEWFWEVLGEFSQEQLSSYLRYVWGRSRLGFDASDRHKITLVSSATLDRIPETHTCYFTIDLGSYSSKDALKEKLLYGMQSCSVIVDGGAFALDSDAIA